MANSMTLKDSIDAQNSVKIPCSSAGVSGESKPQGRKTPIDGNSQNQGKAPEKGF
jgi:hypothetical protein